MRGVQLTDGSRGDFVVKVYGNMSRPAGLPAGTGEWSPIAESDGRVRPENVVMRLEPLKPGSYNAPAEEPERLCQSTFAWKPPNTMTATPRR